MRITFDVSAYLCDLCERALDLMEDKATRPTPPLDLDDQDEDDAALQAQYDEEWRDSPVFRQDEALALPPVFQDARDKAADEATDEALDALAHLAKTDEALDAHHKAIGKGQSRHPVAVARASAAGRSRSKSNGRSKTQAKTHEFTCEHCGKSFRTAKTKARYCTRECYFDSRREVTP